MMKSRTKVSPPIYGGNTIRQGNNNHSINHAKYHTLSVQNFTSSIDNFVTMLRGWGMNTNHPCGLILSSGREKFCANQKLLIGVLTVWRDKHAPCTLSAVRRCLQACSGYPIGYGIILWESGTQTCQSLEEREKGEDMDRVCVLS